MEPIANHDTAIKSLVDGYADVFEGQVMINLLRNLDFYSTYQGSICVDSITPDRFIADFSNAADNVVYRAIRLCRETMRNSPRDSITSQDVMAMLAVLFKAGTISETEFGIAGQRLQELMEAATPMSPEMLKPVISHWLTSVRAKKQIAQANNGQISHFTMLDAINADREVLLGNLEAKTLFTFSEAIADSIAVDKVRHATGLPNLDKCIGGGFAKGEFTLFVQPSGAGKTVAACQLTTSLAGAGLKGIMITTEQPPRELISRMASSRCDVPMDLIKDGLKKEILQPNQQTKLDQLIQLLDQNIFLVDWTDGNKSCKDDLEPLIRQAKKKLGRLDFVILDWIGGSLGKAVQNDPAQFRYVLKFAADSLATTAMKEDVITIGFAQATTMLSKNKKRVDRTMLGECKSMGDRATNIIGGSAMQAEDTGDESQASYLPKQYFFVDKARKGTGGLIPVFRDFAYQRFVDWKHPRQ